MSEHAPLVSHRPAVPSSRHRRRRAGARRVRSFATRSPPLPVAFRSDGRGGIKKVAILAAQAGVGKTTICLHLAALATERAIAICVIDCDPKQSALAWYQERPDDEPSVVEGYQAEGRRLDRTDSLARMIRIAETNEFELAIVDTRPTRRAHLVKPRGRLTFASCFTARRISSAGPALLTTICQGRTYIKFTRNVPTAGLCSNHPRKTIPMKIPIRRIGLFGSDSRPAGKGRIGRAQIGREDK